MSTLKDVYDLLTLIYRDVETFGTTAEMRSRIQKLISSLGKAFRQEQGVNDFEQARALPLDTVLGEESAALLEEIRALLPKRE